MNLTTLAALISEISIVSGLIVSMVVKLKKISNGTLCQLRSEMLRIYYHNREKEIIRQYEYENFVYLYEAYKALKGNSFIDKIYKEVQSWEIVS